MSKTIVFFGNERIATGVTTSAPTLRKLIEADYKVAAVVSSYTQGTSRAARELEIGVLAKEHGIPVLLPDKPKEVLEELAAYKADIGVLVAYGRLVPESIINLFPRGIINIHPSLLPLHRGPTPIESVMLEGADKTGVSLMQLAVAMDAGPVYAQEELELSGKETKQYLADTLLSMGGDMLIENLPSILEGRLSPMTQDDSLATYDDRMTKESGRLDFKRSAEELERQLRAYAGWPKSQADIGDMPVTITKATVASGSGNPGEFLIVDSDLVVTCGSEALIIEMLVPAGKKEMTGQAFVAGYRHLLQ